MAGHARGADPGQVGEDVQAVHPAGRRDRQHGAGKPCTTPGLRAETPLAPQDGRPDGAFGHIVGGFDPGDIQGGPQGGPVLNEGGPVREEGAVEAPGPHPDVGAVATTGDETLEVPGKVCPAQLPERRVQPVVACIAVAADHTVVVRQGQLPDHPATATG